MERRFASRLNELTEQAKVTPELLQDLLPRLTQFLEPFVEDLKEPEKKQRAVEYTTGLISGLERKTGEGIAYLYDQDRQRMQKFIGQTHWDHQPLLGTLATQVGEELGEPDGVIVIDPSAFPKKGDKSVGVGMQWCGRLGKVENCQVGVYLAYVSRKESALVNTRLYLPEKWANDRRRREEAGVPKSIKFQIRHQLALDMLAESGSNLPHSWIAGDDEMGRSGVFRLDLRALGERYLLAVPSNTLVRDIESPLPEYSGRGPRPKNPFIRVDRWCAKLSENAWTSVNVRDGEKGPLVIEAVKTQIRSRTDTGGTGLAEVLFVTRERQADNTYKFDYYLSNADPEEPLGELARVAKAEHRVEECFERAKGEAGLADYQVRNWIAWHHHQTLSLIAAWFLNQETRRGKKTDSCTDVSAAKTADRWTTGGASDDERARFALPSKYSLANAQRTGSLLPL
jgi:SRSO17 transposase